MAEENTDPVYLDLNLGPRDNSNDASEFGSGSYSSFALNFRNWLGTHENQWVNSIARRRQDPVPFEMENTVTGLTGRGAPQTGPSIDASEVRPVEISEISESRSGFSTNETRDKKEDGKNDNDESSFFDCNICLDSAKEPVVTCCGHLFCWPCIYRWLHGHSIAKECPVCKGKVTLVTPIYSQCNNTLESDVDLSMKIPPRPQAQRVESLTQFFRRIRGVRNSFDFGPRLAPIHFQNYTAALSNPTTPINSSESLEAENLITSYSHSDDVQRNQESAQPFEDRDSVSSIAAVIHASSQTVDNAVEIESTVSLSTSSSRRRNRASGNSDVDSRDSRITRRRRLN